MGRTSKECTKRNSKNMESSRDCAGSKSSRNSRKSSTVKNCN